MTHDKEDTKSQISPPALALPVAKGRRMTSNYNLLSLSLKEQTIERPNGH